MKSALKFLVASLAFATMSAHAVVLVQVAVAPHYDFASFSSATVGGLGGVEYNFNELNPGGGTTQSYFGNPVLVAGSGMSFTADESIIADIGVLGNPTVIYTAKTGTSDPNTITATTAGATAIGFYFGSYNIANSPLTVTLTANGVESSFGSLSLPSSIALPAVSNTYNFVGFTSAQAITKIVFTQAPGDNALDIQRFFVGSAAPVPEPSLPIMFGVGLALIGAIGRRRRG